ncbi:MAG: hypothetical protein GY719_01415 [bacterium]|nr:hypothetical protein [bacterium]
MRSRAAFIRNLSVEEVRASLATFGGGVVQSLDLRRGAPVEGAFSYQEVFADLDRELEAVQSGLVSAEDEHVRRRIQVSKVRRQSEEATTSLYDRQVKVRRALAAIYGPDRGFEVAAVEGNTPRSLKALADQVDQTVQLLEEPEGDLPSVVVDGVEVSLGTMATSLSTNLNGVRDLRVDLDRVRKAVGESLVARNKAIEEFDSVFPWVTRTLEGYFRLTGEADLADRIRTSARRVTRRQAEESDGADADEPVQEEPASTVTETVEDVATPTDS